MPILGLRKVEEKKVTDIPDELPSLSEPEVPKPRKDAQILTTLPKLEPEKVVPKPIEIRAPEPPLPQIEQPARVQEYSQPVEPETVAVKPTKLIDHINLIDQLRDRISSTERELGELERDVSQKTTLLSNLRIDLEDEISIVRSELGLDSKSVDVKKKRTLN